MLESFVMSAIPTKKKPFTFDYKALYDSLSPDLVCEALSTAMPWRNVETNGAKIKRTGLWTL